MLGVLNLILLIGILFIVAAIAIRLKVIDSKLRIINFRLCVIEEHFDLINQKIIK